MRPNVVPGLALRLCVSIVLTSCTGGDITSEDDGAVEVDDDGDDGLAPPKGGGGRAGGGSVGAQPDVDAEEAAGGSSTRDAGVSGDTAKAASDAGAVPDGLVAAIVAVGPGGRTAVSCNRGRSFRVNGFHRTPDGDHSPYAVTGLAGGKGAFVIGAGWGAPGRIIASDDGVDWQELGAANYTKRDGSKGPSTQSVSGAFYDGALFKVFWPHTVWESADGRTWRETAARPANISHLRDIAYDATDNLLIMRVERDENGGRTQLVMISQDKGQTFKELAPLKTGCPSFGWGPVAYVNGIMLAGGTAGAMCRSQDMGKTWVAVAGVSGVTSLFTGDDALFVVRGGQLHRSEDGATWTRVLQAPGAFTQGTWSPATGYALAGNNSGKLTFHYSDDGKAWKASAAVTGTGFAARRMQTGFVKPSSDCPVQ